MAFKAAGNPTTLFREHITLNASSFSTTSLCDDFRAQAHGISTPTRNVVRDNTAYSTEPLEDSWLGRNWSWSPANKGGDGQGGSLT